MAGPAHTIRTPRLILRPLVSDDAEAVARGVGNYDVARWLAVVPYPYALADAREFLSSPAAAPGTAWAICDAWGLQGIIGIGRELGYWLARPAWGRGYVTEAGDALIDAWFADRRNRSLRSGYFEGNARSAGALAKLGFVETGRAVRFARPLQQDVPVRDMVLSRARWKERRRFRARSGGLRLRELRDSDRGAVRRLLPVCAPSDPPQDSSAPGLRHWIDTVRFRGRPGFRAAVCLPTGRLVGLVRLARDLTLEVALDPAYTAPGDTRRVIRTFADACFARFDIDAVTVRQPGPAAAPGAADDTTSPARLEPAPNVLYRLDRQSLEAPHEVS